MQPFVQVFNFGRTFDNSDLKKKLIRRKLLNILTVMYMYLCTCIMTRTSPFEYNSLVMKSGESYHFTI